MANDFSSNVDIFFDEVVMGFDAMNVSSKNVSLFKPEAGRLQQGGQTFYRPVQLMKEGTDGRDLTSANKDILELTVPATLTDSHLRNIPVSLVGSDLNSPHIRKQIVEMTQRKLSNRVDVLVANEIAEKGSLLVRNTGLIDTYEEAAVAEALMLEQQAAGMNTERVMLIHPRMALNLAGNLASRGTMTGAPMDAYTRSMLPPIAGFDTFRVDYAKSLTGSAGTGYLINGASQAITPAAEASGLPRDNRSQSLIVDTGSGAAVGDVFTIAGVTAIGAINKQTTGQLRTFRILAINGATWTIAPSIIPFSGGSEFQQAYANVVSGPADNAAITILNTVTTPVSVFYAKDAVEIIHSDYNTEDFSATGKKVRKATTDAGIQIVMLTDSNIDTLTATYRMFVWCNALVLDYARAGIMLQSQT